MSAKWFAFAFAAAFLGTAGAASADDKDKKIDPNALIQKLADRASGLEKKFDKLDTNHDGAVDRAEVDEATKKAFARLDKNDDGVIDKEELANFKAKVAKKKGDDAADMAARRFEKADKNHDGRVTREEFGASIPAWFDRADTNHDGKVTKEEIAGAAIKIRDKIDKAGGDEKPAAEGKSDKEKSQDKPKTDDKADQSDDDDEDMSADKPAEKGDGSKK